MLEVPLSDFSLLGALWAAGEVGAGADVFILLKKKSFQDKQYYSNLDAKHSCWLSC